MLGGFNTNVRYGGRMFHVQTEDSGQSNPKIVTLLYEGGTILYSTKSSYEDRVDAEDLESVVRQLMERQHRAMVTALKSGELEGVLAGGSGATRARPESGGAGRLGDGVLRSRRLDEVIIEHLCS